ncbi:hypothetical protein PInf_030413 [Phytophthora infestans]|nr:hypothetical protein PInf_030413 [Phytophthora infestans]
MKSQTSSLPDLCLLIKQRDVTRLREALEAHPGWYSPLHLACKAGSEEMIWLLLNNGANWNLPDKAKKSPLQWAVRAGKASVAYRIDQQLHAKAKLALQQAREQQQTNKSPLTFAKLCG